MADAELIERLATLPSLAGIPRGELEWLATHGRFEVHEAGAVVGPKGKRIEALWIILSGRIVVHVDRGVGPRQVIGWGTGEVSGMLPYSRMTGPPGDNTVEEHTELLVIDEARFPEMIHRCPGFTTYTVHLMLDRARSFNASDLHDEKMISLGRLAAGLAHELNNPASATIRGAKLLLAGLAEADAASRALGAARLPDEVVERVEALCSASMAESTATILSPLQQADREDELAEWLTRHASDPAFAGPLAATAVSVDALEAMAQAVPPASLPAVLRWFAGRCAARSLALDIERAAGRVSGLVAAVKKFTYMDHLAGQEAVDVAEGLGDTIRVLGSKAKSANAAVALDVEPGLPRVVANGGELNQVWMNLLDNALDAVPESGRVDVVVRGEAGRVVVRVVDNGPGIPAEVASRVFDPFFTTKPPGQGTGLGLEIARRLVRRYGGDISVQSEPGRTEFRVSFPFADSGA